MQTQRSSSLSLRPATRGQLARHGSPPLPSPSRRERALNILWRGLERGPHRAARTSPRPPRHPFPLPNHRENAVDYILRETKEETTTKRQKINGNMVRGTRCSPQPRQAPVQRHDSTAPAR